MPEVPRVRTGASDLVVSVILTWLLVLGAVPASGAEDLLTGPVPAAVEEVIDGDRSH